MIYLLGLLAVSALLAACATASSGAEYHVAKNGKDRNPGTQDQPFLTLQKAADVMQAGDACIIHEGVYRETVRPRNSGRPDAPIRFLAAPGEEVTVSGADVLEGAWQVHEGAIYRAATDRKFAQLFVDGRMMNEARWPNGEAEQLVLMPRASAGKGTGRGGVADPSLPPGEWEGALVTIWPGREWRNFSRRVVNYSPGAGFDFDRPFERNPNDPYHDFDPILPEEGNHYVLSGCLAALDIPTEWFLDEESGVIYLWTPDGRSPAEHLVEVKQRDLAFDLRDRAHIELHGLRIFAAAVSMEGSDHCVADGCRVRYVGHFRGGASNRGAEEANCNLMTGSHNEWRNSSVAHAAGDAFRLGGEGNAITNCIIYDVNYSGGHMAAISTSDGCRGAAITRCTIYNSGREIISHLHAAALRIERNHIYNAGLLTKDNGMTKTWGTDGKGSVIAYNWVHHNHAEYGCGIYLDNFNQNFIVHHNVVWAVSDAGIRLNSDCLDNLVANNTLPGEMGFAVYNYPNYPPTQKGTRVLNNLVRGRMQFVTGENAPTTDRNGDFPLDARLVPTADSGAVDAGVTIPGITDGFAGAAPDIGAYERGGDYWVPGADWTEEGGPPPQTPAEATAAAEKAMGAKR